MGPAIRFMRRKPSILYQLKKAWSSKRRSVVGIYLTAMLPKTLQPLYAMSDDGAGFAVALILQVHLKRSLSSTIKLLTKLMRSGASW